uniref:Uncharacterized protein n=1 Tax=Myoviridae sp. ctshb19 TaxID=2825194 RepID=A0A8S5UGN2_9CAUD|nr:MAG TPA: hypothetical protein [Myoviridae sp. ctshb19]
MLTLGGCFDTFRANRAPPARKTDTHAIREV